jgi:hypothetical protein
MPQGDWLHDQDANKFNNSYFRDANNTGFAVDMSGDLVVRGNYTPLYETLNISAGQVGYTYNGTLLTSDISSTGLTDAMEITGIPKGVYIVEVYGVLTGQGGYVQHRLKINGTVFNNSWTFTDIPTGALNTFRRTDVFPITDDNTTLTWEFFGSTFTANFWGNNAYFKATRFA